MKEVKREPIAKLTEIQLTRLRSLIAQINITGNAFDRAFHLREEFMDKVRKTYGITVEELHINPQTGEMFETWPKV